MRETLSFYLVGVLLFVGLIVSDLLNATSGALLRQNTSLADVLKLVLYYLPRTLGIALSFGLVFAILLALSRWIRLSELKAAFASGVHPFALVWPVLGLGSVVALLSFFVWGWLKPAAQVKFDALFNRIYGVGAPAGVLMDKLYAPPGHPVFYAQRIYPDQKLTQLENVRIVEQDGTTWVAPRGEWVEGAWRLQEAYRVETDGSVVKVGESPVPFPSGYVPQASRSFDSMSLPELTRVARVDLEARFPLARRYADALGALVLAWLAVVIGLSLRESAWAFVAVVAMLFGYYAIWTLAARFSQADLFGPVSAWLPDLTYALLALAFSLRLR